MRALCGETETGLPGRGETAERAPDVSPIPLCYWTKLNEFYKGSSQWISALGPITTETTSTATSQCKEQLIPVQTSCNRDPRGQGGETGERLTRGHHATGARNKAGCRRGLVLPSSSTPNTLQYLQTSLTLGGFAPQEGWHRGALRLG